MSDFIGISARDLQHGLRTDLGHLRKVVHLHFPDGKHVVMAYHYQGVPPRSYEADDTVLIEVAG